MTRSHRLALVLLLVGCSPSVSPAKLDAGVADCRLRARAGAGEYQAAFEVCLVDRAHFRPELAASLSDAEHWRADGINEGDRRERWSSFRLYASSLRVAQFRGADPGWVARTVQQDSAIWVRVDSMMDHP